jgi:UDP-glucose-4-epimerase GalE
MTDYVLVTGGAGFIGSHACKALAKTGLVPVAYDNLSNGHEWAVKWGPLERGDVLDRSRLRAVLDKYRPRGVIHFAAYAYVGESVVDPEKYYINNVQGTLSLLSAMRERGLRRIVFSSTCAVYGDATTRRIGEDHELKPINPYGATKLTVERMLRDFDRAYGIKSVSLRYFNAAGADPDGEIGEHHEPEPHLIPRILDVALGRSPHVEVYGTDYETSDGTCVRDFIHVADLADAHVLAARRLDAGGETTAFNLGTGEGYSVKQVIATAERVTGTRINTVFRDRRPGDPPILVADRGSAHTELGWHPRRSALHTQVEDSWRWHKAHFRSKAGGVATARSSVLS